MSFNYLDDDFMKDILVKVWKIKVGEEIKDFLTKQDGLFLYESPLTGEPGGLMGRLREGTQSLRIDQSSALDNLSEDQNPLGQAIDNRNGLITEPVDVQLSTTIIESISTTSGTTKALRAGASFKKEFNLVAAKKEISFHVEAEHTWHNSETDSTTYEDSSNTTFHVSVPRGKVYELIENRLNYEIEYQYKVTLPIKGITEGWFDKRVKGPYGENEYAHGMNAGEVFQIIHDHSLIKDANVTYCRHPNHSNWGAVIEHGSVKAVQTKKITTVEDITEQYAE